jgi:proteasome lid subunit RPN8/RPN11
MISLPPELLHKIRKHAEEAYPEEGAGLLLGHHDGETRFVESILPLQNTFAVEQRHHRYMITPEEMILAEEQADDMGLDIIGVFHSHPNHPAQPSEFDRERALPWYSYLISSVHEQGALESRSWRLSDDRTFTEEKLLIEQKRKLEE